MTLQPSRPTGDAARYVASLVADGSISTRKEVEAAKKRAAVLFGLGSYVPNSEILASLPARERAIFEEMLRVHPRRSASGIIVVTAFSAPYSCPHGTCVFCPGGPRFGTPQSYLKDSPGMRGALAVGFDPREQVRRSLRKYAANGHSTGKVEAIIEGGTFIATPADYQASFVRGVYEGLNGEPSGTLEEAQLRNQSAESRCVGLTLESKPDRCTPPDVDLMLGYGVTKLEIGVQSLRDAALSRSNRGHTVADTFRAFQVARDAGLKVAAHMMPGLPGASPDEDLEDLRRLFEDEGLRPDMSKIYPTLVVPGTALEMQMKAGLYEPYPLELVVDMLSDMKAFVPPWHRIMRIQREIPSYEISGGVRNGNLRELVLARAAEKGIACRCIRCREVALAAPEEGSELRYRESRYAASGGTEVFGSYEDGSGRVAGFVRMRVPSEQAHRPEMRRAAVVRELRVYGRAVGVGRRSDRAWQHRGTGGAMMKAMEKEAAEGFDATRLLVTSAVGTRDYYRGLGYERLGPFMSKTLA